MDSIVFDRLREICPDKAVADMSISELKEDCHVAFEIIGYNPIDLDTAVEEVYVNHDIKHLYEFIFRVWSVDK